MNWSHRTGRPGTVDLSSDRLVDLSHAFNRRTIYWPTARAVQADRGRRRARPRAAGTTRPTTSQAAEHGGTHLDAPIHFSATATRPTRSRCARSSARRSSSTCARKANADPDYLVSVADIAGVGGRARADRARTRSCCCARAGRAAGRTPGATSARPSAARPPCRKLHFPGLHPGRPRGCSSSSGGSARSASTPPASTAGSRRRSRRTACSAAAQCRCSRTSRTSTGCRPRASTSIALPMKIEGGSGGPLRAMAIVQR